MAEEYTHVSRNRANVIWDSVKHSLLSQKRDGGNFSALRTTGKARRTKKGKRRKRPLLEKFILLPLLLI